MTHKPPAPNPQWVIRRFESVASTNDVAIRMADERAPEGTVVIAGEQTAGKGRLGRSWSSPAGEGLYLSAILRPDLPFDQVWQTGFVASVAAAEAIGEVSGLPAQIKWPNDILLSGRKVCGILVEARKSAASSQQPAVSPQSAIRNPKSQIPNLRCPIVVGIGVNVNNSSFPAEIAQKATSVALEVGHPIKLQKVEEAVLSRLHTRYTQHLSEGFAPILEAWKNLDCTIGRHVVVLADDGTVEGTAVGVDSSGDLVVEREDGVSVRLAAGEVTLLDTT